MILLEIMITVILLLVEKKLINREREREREKKREKEREKKLLYHISLIKVNLSLTKNYCQLTLCFN